jgi:tetratricopeptide (TPR) repeat protein
VHSVFWLEYHLWSDSTFGYHFVNILLHFLSVLLLVCILRRLAIPGAWFIAAIFALHPAQVESVAWITELKNTLSGVFFFAAVLAYLQFDNERKRKLYLIAIGFFILGLMSKSVIAILPVSLLVVFWWKRGKIDWKNDIVPLLPFFAVGIAYGLFTAWVERKFIGAEGSAFTLTIIERCLIAGRVIWFYLGKIFLPINLIFIYPRWNVSQTIWWQYLFPVATLILVGILWTLRNRSRAPLAAFLLFTAMLFPVLGFFNVYPFRFSFVADHFLYLACIGPIALLTAGTESAFVLLKGNQQRFIKSIIYIIILVAFSVLTWKQSWIYADAETLYSTTTRKNPACWMAYNNLGMLLEKNGRSDVAISYYRKALEINSFFAEAHNNLGLLLAKSGRTDEAIDHYQKALAINPNYEKTLNNFGNLLSDLGRTNEAMTYYRKALEIDPNYDEVHYNFGIVLMQAGQTDEAIVHFQKALEINPTRSEGHYNLAFLLMKIGRTDEAIAHYQKAVQINPNYGKAHINLGNALFQTGQVDEAIFHYQRALEINPNKISTLQNLATAFKQKGQLADAITILQKALTLAKASGDESMLKEITVNLDRLNQMIRSTPQGSR